MNNAKKHTDVVASMEEFTTNYNNGVYTSPWIVYVGNNDDGYSVIYSNDENKTHHSAIPNVIDSLTKRIQTLEDEKVYCYEDEYDILVTNKQGWVTNLDGTRSEVVFDVNKMYCIYEEDINSPETPEEPTPEEPEKVVEFVGDVLMEEDYTPETTIILTNVETKVNLNGKNITAPTFVDESDNSTNSIGFWVQNGANLTIEGEGEIMAQEANYSMAVWANGGTVRINGGTFRNAGESCDLIYASAGGHVDIYGGEFIATPKGVEAGTGNDYSALNIKNADRGNSSITVYGGRFFKFNPADNISEGPGTNFVADGYESIQDGDWWEVRKIENNI
jgi:hypothetical protein